MRGLVRNEISRLLELIPDVRKKFDVVIYCMYNKYTDTTYDPNKDASNQAKHGGLDASRAEARRLKAQQAIMPTLEEDATITAAALNDPDNPPLAKHALASFTPASLVPRRPRGRPAKDATKVPTTMRLDSDVVDSFKATGEGWQTRMNEALREHLKARNMLAHRYHATVHRKEKETDQLGEFLVVAADDGQAKAKVKRYLQALGMSEAVGAQVYTVDVGNARMAELDTIY